MLSWLGAAPPGSFNSLADLLEAAGNDYLATGKALDDLAAA
jgi:hypothetical protein